ncbi:polysaccharide biosynthesis tyrosine autokinase [Geothrix sp. SG200]|uniref:polysaccharide biosynthesis tyrosine autokinase n=1 Tax=Geothrix sp. SG200 TaxID=2922865 RepID=UPI001FAB7F47|nr:polysaccharide biosynthesis tyrosine autokinase [Geothrix sp. SG200]
MSQSEQPIRPNLRGGVGFEHRDETSLGELVALLWDARFLILGTTLVALILGVYVTWRTTPIYQVEALLQVEDKKGGKGGPGMEALSALLDQPAAAQTEIEILRSNLVLGRTVESLALDIAAQPQFNPLLGDALVRGRLDAPTLRIERFDVPAPLRGTPFRIVAQGNGAFLWEAPDGRQLASGHEGEILQATWRGQPMLLQVRALLAAPGQRFDLIRRPYLQAIEALRQNLHVAEKGKQTNILSLSFESPDPNRGAEILNEIVAQYIGQNIARKAEEASRSLAFLQEQLPQLKAKLEAAENQLNQYRMQTGSADLTEETKLVLKQSVDLEGQILALRQKKEELLRTYKERADVVATLDQQIAKLGSEARQLDGKVRALPRTQQELVRLMREVQVSTDMYTSMLNSVQQLQVAKAGEIGNARIVDHALPSLGPVKPQKAVAVGLSAVLGLLGGIGLALLRKALHRGVTDPRLIEVHLGLPVVVTVPHSLRQEGIQKELQRGVPGKHLLAETQPEDLAVESLRSLRTSLHFSMLDARNSVVLFTGPTPAIGKTFVSANFATLLAQAGNRVLLVDGDLRRGYLHRPFGLPERGRGLSEVLAGQVSWREALNTSLLPSLDLLTTGALPPNPSELLMGRRLVEFIQEVSSAYDLVLIDAPPVMAVTDPVILGKHAGTTLLITKAEQHSLEELQLTLQRLEGGGVKVQGCVFNDLNTSKLGYRYYGYSYRQTSRTSQAR